MLPADGGDKNAGSYCSTGETTEHTPLPLPESPPRIDSIVDDIIGNVDAPRQGAGEAATRVSPINYRRALKYERVALRKVERTRET